jgi:hypothetical protein
MSLFLQTLVLRGILSSEQEHRQEHMNLGAAEARRKAVLKRLGGSLARGILKHRVETCIRSYEKHESFRD